MTDLERKQDRSPVPADWTYAPAPESREIVRLRLENYSVPEISRKVGRSEHRVRKLLDRVAELWERLNS